MESLDQFDEIQSSALKELANIGISHVATTIGEISREKIDISLPELKVFFKQQVMSPKNEDSGFVAAYLPVDGLSQISEMLLILKKKDALGLIDKFINSSGGDKVDIAGLSFEEQKSIFVEISTIISSTYFSAVESMFCLQTNHGVPTIGFESEKINDFIKETLRQDKGVSIKTSFIGDQSNIKGVFFLILDQKTLGVFFSAIGLAV